MKQYLIPIILFKTEQLLWGINLVTDLYYTSDDISFELLTNLKHATNRHKMKLINLFNEIEIMKKTLNDEC